MAENKSFWFELKRRHVVRAGVAHVVLFWLLAQVAETILPYFGIVDEPVRWAVVVGVALFPVTLLISWFVEHPWHKYTSSRLAMDIAVIAVIAIAAGSWTLRNLPQVIHARSSIVILPFEFQEKDSGGRSLSRALAYEINGLLMKSKSVDVVGYDSANSPLLNDLDVPGIAELLNVQHLLTGTVLSAGNPFRVAVKLSDRGGRSLWSGVFEDKLDSLYDIQQQIAVAVESRLGSGEESVPVAQLAKARCPMPLESTVLERYYTARHYIEARTDTDQSIAEQTEAVRIYQELISEYPDFAQARSALAWALMHLTVYDPDSHSADVNGPKAQQLAMEAVALCPSLGEAIVLVPNEVDHSNTWINEEQNLQLWMELQPESSENYQKYIRHLREVGRLQEALVVARRNYALNPLSVRSIKSLSLIYQYIDRFDEAIALHDRAVELGSTGQDYARTWKQMSDCMKDLECFLENLPEPYSPFRGQFRIVYTAPETPEDVLRSSETAMELFHMAPDMTINWFNATSCEFDHLTPLFFELWKHNQEIGAYWYWPNVWLTRCGNVWGSPEFPAFVEESGLVEYWRAKGWADACRPEGEGFICGQAVFDRNQAEK